MLKNRKSLIIISVIVIILIGIFNAICDTDKFFSMSLFNVINLIILIIFSFYLTQQFTDERKQKDIIDAIILKIQDYIMDSKFNGDVDIERKDVLQLIKFLRLKSSFLKKLSNKKNIIKELESIEKFIYEINDLSDQYNNSENGFKDGLSQFKRVFSNIDNCCDNIRKELFF